MRSAANCAAASRERVAFDAGLGTMEVVGDAQASRKYAPDCHFEYLLALMHRSRVFTRGLLGSNGERRTLFSGRLR